MVNKNGNSRREYQKVQHLFQKESRYKRPGLWDWKHAQCSIYG
jgi:hypothetical protein